ncbi:MAG: acylphosphatase [Verrucomicrobiae bacterium]|nr:acylphosphatase [Verrucomicrobiae bacterium]NNJ43354.1 acylphosphatase [Akkermansiaceae bacterium]
MIAKQAIFEGRVQGVGFRYEVKQIAMGFDVVGWIKNMPDGTVELHAMGEEEEMAEFLREISEESAMTHHIKEMHCREIPLMDNVRGFTITA